MSNETCTKTWTRALPNGQDAMPTDSSPKPSIRPQIKTSVSVLHRQINMSRHKLRNEGERVATFVCWNHLLITYIWNAHAQPACCIDHTPLLRFTNTISLRPRLFWIRKQCFPKCENSLIISISGWSYCKYHQMVLPSARELAIELPAAKKCWKRILFGTLHCTHRKERGCKQHVDYRDSGLIRTC